MAVRGSRFVRSVVAGLALLMTAAAVSTGPAVADPPGTMVLNPAPVDPPEVKILGASPAGVLYSAIGAYESGPWLKPVDAAPVRVPGFFELAGSMLFANPNEDWTVISYRTVADPTIHSCAVEPFQDRKYLPTGWIAADPAGSISLVTAAPGGCSTRSLTTIPNSRLVAADTAGLVVEITTDVGDGGVHMLEYRSFADPSVAHVIDTGDRVYNYVSVSGSVVGWHSGEPNGNEGFVHRWRRGSGSDPVVRLLGTVLNLVVTDGATGYVRCDDGCRAGSIPAGGGVTSEMDGVRSLVSDGQAFYLALLRMRPSIYRGPSLSDPAALERIVTIPLMPAATEDIALGASLIAYRDSDNAEVEPDWAAQHIRSYKKSGNSITVSAAVSRGAGREQLLGISAGRMLIRTWDETSTSQRLLLRITGATDRVVFASTDEYKVSGGAFVISGSRVLWTRSEYSGDPCNPGCPQFDTRSAMLFDLRTGTSTRLGDATWTRFTLWGPYVVSADTDGVIRRRDLTTGRTVVVKPAGPAAEISAWGPYVAWSQCSVPCRTGLLAYRNVDTMAATVRVGTPTVATRLKVTGGHIVYTLASFSTNPTDPDLRQLRIGATTTTKVSDLRGHTESGQYFDAYDEVLAWVGRDGSARIAVNTPFVDPPRYLGNAVAPAGFSPDGDGHHDRWMAEFPISKALPTCSVTIRSAFGVVRTLGCGTATGRARVGWDGRNSAGQLVAAGQYSWTLAGRDEDGTLRWWNGRSAEITGSVTVA